MKTTLQQYNKEKNRKQMISLLFLIGSIAIGFFFALDQGYGYMEKKDALETAKKESIEKKWTLEALQNARNNIVNNVDIQDDIERYGSAFREDTILDSLFVPISGVSIASVSMSKGEKMPNGLSLASISVSFKAQNTNAFKNFLSYLTNGKDNNKSYIIKSLAFPFDTTKDDPISTTVELGMYYFE